MSWQFARRRRISRPARPAMADRGMAPRNRWECLGSADGVEGVRTCSRRDAVFDLVAGSELSARSFARLAHGGGGRGPRRSLPARSSASCRSGARLVRAPRAGSAGSTLDLRTSLWGRWPACGADRRRAGAAHRRRAVRAKPLSSPTCQSWLPHGRHIIRGPRVAARARSEG